MKKKVFLFFIFIFFILSIVPVINLVSGVKKFKVKYIYNVDFVIPKINRVLYSYGLNINPGQVIVGKKGWLYLGDDYAETVTLARDGVGPSYVKRAIDKRDKLDSWNAFFKSKGVKDFKILIGPNKSSIYPEFLPSWFELSINKKIEILEKTTKNRYYISPESVLLSTKKLNPEHDLYYKTDTHWNKFGSWVAFDYFIREVKDKSAEINYNQEALVKGSVEKYGGDLSGFLRLSGEIKDQEQVVEVSPYFKVDTDCQVFYTNEKVECSDNPEIISQSEPLLVISTGSLNDKKILWIRDSFGTAVSPYMARTFSNVIQIHYDNLDKEKLVNIVEDFKPDYVFMTIVERSIDSGLPIEYPEIELDKNKVHSYSSEFVTSNDLERVGDTFSVSGGDPFLIYKLERQVNGGFHDTVTVSLICESNKKEKVDVQFFWKKRLNDDFSESNSERYSVSQGVSHFFPSLNPNWNNARDIQYLRLDIEPSSTNRCMRFDIKNLVFNKEL